MGIVIERMDGPVLTIGLSHPEKLNAIDAGMWIALR